MSFLQLVLSLDKTKEGINSILGNMSSWHLDRYRNKEWTSVLYFNVIWLILQLDFITSVLLSFIMRGINATKFANNSNFCLLMFGQVTLVAVTALFFRNICSIETKKTAGFFCNIIAPYCKYLIFGQISYFSHNNQFAGGGETTYYLVFFFAKNCMKIKRNWNRGGSLCPPGSVDIEADADPVTHVCFGLRLMFFQFVPAEDAPLWLFPIDHVSNIR